MSTGSAPSRPAPADEPTRRQPRCGLTGSGSHQRWVHAPLARELFVINNLMTRCGDRLVGDLGLTAARWKMLGAIDSLEENPPTLSDLSSDALLSVQNVSRMVAAMEADGLVERFTRSGMGRAVFVRATDAGRRVLDEAFDRATRFTARFLAGFDDKEIGVLQGAFDRMIDNLEAFERELCDERHCTVPQARTGNE